MSEAMPDPTLATLVPEPSTRRNLVLGTAAVALLAGTWFLAPLLRPALIVNGNSYQQPLDGHPVSLVRITATGQLTVDAVGDTDVAEVVGAWVVPDSDSGPALLDVYGPEWSAEDLLRASGIDPDAATLPTSLSNDETVWLMVTWRATDCPLTGPAPWGDVTVHSPLGVERDQAMDGGAPAYLADETSGDGCP